MSITLVGDSVLDNFYWLADKHDDLTNQLQTKGYQVTNLAVDESQVKDVIYGIKPRNIYQNARPYPYPVNELGMVHPIELLDQVHSDMIVLSVGGNDFRVNISKLMKGIGSFIDAVLNPEFIANLRHILTNMTLRSRKLILILVYIPYLGPGLLMLYYQDLKTRSMIRSEIFI